MTRQKPVRKTPAKKGNASKDPFDELKQLVRAIQAANGKLENYDLEIDRMAGLFRGQPQKVLHVMLAVLRHELILVKPSAHGLDPDPLDRIPLLTATTPAEDLCCYGISKRTTRFIRLASEQRMTLGVSILINLVAIDAYARKHVHPFKDSSMNMVRFLLFGGKMNT